jgi:ribosome-binding protein aMBF1 (putative translation factor)
MEGKRRCGGLARGCGRRIDPRLLISSQIPSDYDDQIRHVRRRLGLTQAQFAARVGAAPKAVVYQSASSCTKMQQDEADPALDPALR